MAVPGDRERIVRLETRAREAESALQQLRTYVELLRKKSAEPDTAAVNAATEQLEQENRQLRVEVDRLKEKLVALDIRGGVAQVPTSAPASAAPLPSKSEDRPEPKDSPSEPAEQPPPQETGVKEKGKKKEKVASRGGGGAERSVDVSRLDLRIGRILRAWKHPDADTLYVEEVDVGEEKPRNVCSGLVKHVPVEEMQDRLVMMLCNLKHMKMRGVPSEAMVMCASSPDQVEILDPPADSIPGERISCEGYTGPPDALLNPKKKIFESVQPELHTNAEGVACYRDIPLMVPGKGVFRAATMRNSGIK